MSMVSYSRPISSSAQRTANDELPVMWKNSMHGSYQPLWGRQTRGLIRYATYRFTEGAAL
jgi:hypothetical protein